MIRKTCIHGEEVNIDLVFVSDKLGLTFDESFMGTGGISKREATINKAKNSLMKVLTQSISS